MRLSAAHTNGVTEPKRLSLVNYEDGQTYLSRPSSQAIKFTSGKAGSPDARDVRRYRSVEAEKREYALQIEFFEERPDAYAPNLEAVRKWKAELDSLIAKYEKR